ncbi:GapR family DNA-binding domain-containing protein [Mesorhizobium sp.]|uniref:DUF2312 domain-containing protein n=1 Tax=Mesorhizobium sp. TaxID=1871066 RepID=UPI0025F235A3|nr:GapR family DNA-binding domain-containing protein [Mesorhizobium sp.]
MSGPDIAGGDNAKTVAVNKLRNYAERIERLDEERKEIGDQIKEVKAEAKADGFNSKALNAVLSLRKKDEETRTAIGLYAEALGCFG